MHLIVSAACAFLLAATPASEVVVFNRPIAAFREPVLGVSAADRAIRAEARILELLDRPGSHEVGVKPSPVGQVITIGGSMAYVLVPGDVDPLSEETFEQAVARSAQVLGQVVAEKGESRSVRLLLRGLVFAAVATLLFVLLSWAVRRLGRKLSDRLADFAAHHGRRLKLGDAEVVGTDRVVAVIRWLVGAASWAIVALFAYEWLGFVLGRFPYTRPWGERLVRFLADLASGMAHSVVGAIPGIAVAVVIFVVARFVVDVSDSVFDRAAQGKVRLRWLDRDTAGPTRRIASLVIWLFALAMAYPYLPGAQSEAFKGISVLVGLMVSLGATSVVGQAAAGLILMYTRTFRVGEYVRVNDIEGTVVDTGLFVTRIRTGLGEDVTLSNATINGATTRNYSRTAPEGGFVLDATVTIGYDAPWRQVEAMLLEAAHRTEGVVAQPPPRVHQLALSDFYVEYRLVTCAVPRQPVPRALALTALHANIQDVFNEHGVQIMSPHYLGDPASAKVVPPAGWYAPPARRPGGGST